MKPFSGIALLAFLSALLFGGGVFLHVAPPVKPAAVVKTATAAAHGKKKPAPKAKAAPAGAEDPRAFSLLGAGGGGLLLSVLLALGLSRASAAPAPATRRHLEAEQAARRRQQDEFEEQSAALQSQLREETHRKAETEALREQVSRQFQEFFRTLPVPCFCFAANGKIIRWNAACETLYGIPAASALDSTLWETVVPDSGREDAEAKIQRVLGGESLLDTERWDTVAGGGLARLRCSMVPLYGADGAIIGGLSAGVHVPEAALAEASPAPTPFAALSAGPAVSARPARDVEMSSKMLDEIIVSATLSSGVCELSGQPAFRARLAEEAERAARYHSSLSLVLLDLDGFAGHSKALGREAADETLRSAVSVLKSKLRLVDVIAHLGAGEYAILLPETGEAGARVAAERLRAGLAGTGSGTHPAQTACFGVVQLSPELSGPGEMTTRAEAALQSAKALGADTIVHYQDLPETGAAPAAPPARRKRPAGKSASAA